MTVLESLFLGIVQGLTEFIPVSSSGHLDLLPQVFSLPRPQTFMILFAHFGTLLALILYFRKDLLTYTSVLRKKVTGTSLSTAEARDWRMVLSILVACIPTFVIGFLLESTVDQLYDTNPENSVVNLLTLLAMTLMGVIFIFSDNYFKVSKKTLYNIPFLYSFIIGAVQALAFIRGFSRSGVTILSAQYAGLSRVDAAKFSFLLGIPVIAGSAAYGFYKFISLDLIDPNEVILPGLTVIIASFATGYIAIKFMLSFLRQNGLKAFGYYRLAFAFIVFLILSI